MTLPAMARLRRFDRTEGVSWERLLAAAYSALRSERVEVSCGNEGVVGYETHEPVRHEFARHVMESDIPRPVLAFCAEVPPSRCRRKPGGDSCGAAARLSAFGLTRLRLTTTLGAPQAKLILAMKVTVCQLHDEPAALPWDWERLVAHTHTEHSDLVLLPEMPFFPWFPTVRGFNAKVWEAAVAAHDAWEGRLEELAPAAVLGSRPIDFGSERYNVGFIWEQDTELRGVHRKACLPDQEDLWEASWFHPAPPDFVPAQVGDVNIGFLIGTELWMMEQARIYAREHVHLLVTPRVTDAVTLDRWLVAGCVAALLAGAFGLSSNRVDKAGRYGGQGWIVNPDGDVLALTSGKRPFLTLEIDSTLAEQAKSTFPQYPIV